MLIEMRQPIGSTAVPGLAAKPIVAIQLSVDDREDEESFLRPCSGLGYHLRVRETGHRMVQTADLAVHLHVCEAGSEWEWRTLLFGNRLGIDRDDRELHETVRRRLARRSWADMNSYARAKDDVAAEILVWADRDALVNHPPQQISRHGGM